MLKIEFVHGLTPTGAIVKQDFDRGVLLVEYAAWCGMDEKRRIYILEHEEAHCAAHQRWLERNRQALAEADAFIEHLSANEKRLVDTLEKMEDEVDYKLAFEACEAAREMLLSTHETVCAEVSAWRNIAKDMLDAWHSTFDADTFVKKAKPIMDRIYELRRDIDVPTDKARMSVGEDVDLGTCTLCGRTDVCHACETDTPEPRVVDIKAPEVPIVDMRGIPEPAKDHVIRGYDTDTDTVVYWQEKWSWGTTLSTARKFTRAKALEMANNTNSVAPSHHIINVCAVSF